MTDTQILTLALVFVAAIGSIIYNNSRITDLRTDMNNRFNDVNRHVEDKFKLLDQKIDDKFQIVIDRLQRMEDNLTRILGDHETRIQAIEGKKS